MPTVEPVEIRLVEHLRGGYALKAFAGTHPWVREITMDIATFCSDAEGALRFDTVKDALTAVIFCDNLVWVKIK